MAKREQSLHRVAVSNGKTWDIYGTGQGDVVKTLGLVVYAPFIPDSAVVGIEKVGGVGKFYIKRGKVLYPISAKAAAVEASMDVAQRLARAG